jgi:sec-independent protein translocase protein TatA
MPGNIGWQGLIVILLIALIVFGPKRLPEMGRSLGRGMREFKDSISGATKFDDDDDDRPARREDRRALEPSEPERAPRAERESESERVSS